MRISMKDIWRNLDGPPKNKELWSYVVKFEFSRRKVAQIGPSWCWVVSLGCPYEPWKGPVSCSRCMTTQGKSTQHILFLVIWLRTYGIGPFRYQQRKPLPPLYGLQAIRLQARFLYMYHPTERTVHTTAFVSPVVERTLLTRTYISLP